MSVFGTRAITYNHRTGAFDCPACKSTVYQHKRVRRFVTVSVLPVVPLSVVGEYIECVGCRGTFNIAVLDRNTNNKAFEAEFQRVIRRVLVLMMLADGVVEEREIAAIQVVYSKLTKDDFTRERIEAEVERARTDTENVMTYLANVTSTLNDRDRELVLRAALMVAAADGTIATEELDMLRAFADAMDMSPAHVNTVLASVADL